MKALLNTEIETGTAALAVPFFFTGFGLKYPACSPGFPLRPVPGQIMMLIPPSRTALRRFAPSFIKWRLFREPSPKRPPVHLSSHGSLPGSLAEF